MEIFSFTELKVRFFSFSPLFTYKSDVKSSIPLRLKKSPEPPGYWRNNTLKVVGCLHQVKPFFIHILVFKFICDHYEPKLACYSMSSKIYNPISS